MINVRSICQINKIPVKSKQLSSGAVQWSLRGIACKCALTILIHRYLSSFCRDLNFENRTIFGWVRQLESFSKFMHIFLELRIAFNFQSNGIMCYDKSFKTFEEIFKFFLKSCSARFMSQNRLSRKFLNPFLNRVPARFVVHGVVSCEVLLYSNALT